MGRVIIQVKLINYGDYYNAVKGLISQNQVRLWEGEALVDTGATMVSVPKSISEQLGLLYADKDVTVTFANGQKGKRKVANGILIQIGDRQSLTSAMVEDNYQKVLIGQIPLEEMDLHVDCKNGKLVPSAESPDMPLIEML